MRPAQGILKVRENAIWRWSERRQVQIYRGSVSSHFRDNRDEVAIIRDRRQTYMNTWGTTQKGQYQAVGLGIRATPALNLRNCVACNRSCDSGVRP